MRIIVILSPTNKYGTKTAYTKLRKFLLTDGYVRISQEVFMRVVPNRKDVDRHYKRFYKYLPTTGTVRYLTFTELQYKNIKTFNFDNDTYEEVIGSNEHIIIE